MTGVAGYWGCWLLRLLGADRHGQGLERSTQNRNLGRRAAHQVNGIQRGAVDEVSSVVAAVTAAGHDVKTHVAAQRDAQRAHGGQGAGGGAARVQVKGVSRRVHAVERRGGGQGATHTAVGVTVGVSRAHRVGSFAHVGVPNSVGQRSVGRNRSLGSSGRGRIDAQAEVAGRGTEHAHAVGDRVEVSFQGGQWYQWGGVGRGRTRAGVDGVDLTAICKGAEGRGPRIEVQVNQGVAAVQAGNGFGAGTVRGVAQPEGDQLPAGIQAVSQGSGRGRRCEGLGAGGQSQGKGDER